MSIKGLTATESPLGLLLPILLVVPLLLFLEMFVYPYCPYFLFYKIVIYVPDYIFFVNTFFSVLISNIVLTCKYQCCVTPSSNIPPLISLHSPTPQLVFTFQNHSLVVCSCSSQIDRFSRRSEVEYCNWMFGLQKHLPVRASLLLMQQCPRPAQYSPLPLSLTLQVNTAPQLILSHVQ